MRVFSCQRSAAAPPEPLGDREGHSISVEQHSCRVEGAYAGGVSTDTIIWEWDGAKAVELSNVGVVRKPGSTLTWKGTEGKLTLTITDGKVTGCTGSGRGVEHLGDRRLGQIGRQGLYLDGKVRRPGVAIYR